MICYMPFSYISEERLGRVIHFFGKVAMYQPADFLLTDVMRRHSEAGELDVRIPAGVDPVKLRRVLQEFKGWAGRIQSRAGDLTSFFKTLEGRFPLMDENNPSQIGTQIRRHGQPAATDADPLFQALLFMAMAHEFDGQQEALNHELGSIQALERRMFDRLTGRPEEIDEVFEALKVEPARPQPEEAGAYMTEQRIQAWAISAAADPSPPWAYVTHSRAVWESLGEKLPEMTLAAQWAMAPALHGEEGAERRTSLEALAFSPEQFKEPVKATESGPGLSLYVLPNCDPQHFCARLSGRPITRAADPAARRPLHTVLGLLATP